MELEQQISFMQNVMSRLIGPSYLVPSVSLVRLLSVAKITVLSIKSSSH